MDCGQVTDLLDPYLDDRMDDPLQARDLEAHLVACAACRARHESWLTMRSALRDYPRIAASPGFDAGVLSRILARRRIADGWLNRLDAIFARPAYKLLGSATLGIALALLIAGSTAVSQGMSLPLVKLNALGAGTDRHTPSVQPLQTIEGLTNPEQATSNLAYADWIRALRARRAKPDALKSSPKELSWDAGSELLS